MANLGPLLTLPRAILFDLDDTLLDDSGGARDMWREVTIRVVGESGRDRAEELLAEIDRERAWYWSDPERHRIGRHDMRAATRTIVETAAHATYGRPEADLAATIAEQFRDRRDAAIKPFPGAIATLERVRGRGLATALVTNGSAAAQRAKIERFDLARYFDHVLIEGEFGCGKPDPVVFKTTLAGLGVSPTDSWMVGDNLEWDVAAPQRLGIAGIWIDRHDIGVPVDCAVVPDRILPAVDQLLDAVN